MIKYLPLIALLILTSGSRAQKRNKKETKFRVVVLSEDKGHHVEYSKAAKVWLDNLARDNSFTVDYIQKTDSINEQFLNHYQLFIQLDYPPYGWNEKAAKTFQNYIEQGKIGWIGFHHATLLGEFDGFPMWNWFSDFMGSIRYENYIATFVKGDVNVEVKNHPCMKGVLPGFTIGKEEWYTYNKSPRQNVKVLASVDESTYSPASTIKMGDHPVVWINEKVAARNIYIFMGHSPELFKNNSYTTLFRNAIFWASQK
ncbi:MAG TPA: ThuA domain-containing protein [Cyclobacteriaceae bacterium]